MEWAEHRCKNLPDSNSIQFREGKGMWVHFIPWNVEVITQCPYCGVALHITPPERIFSGDYSESLWDDIATAKTVKDLKDVIYTVCCRLQELEEKWEGDTNRKVSDEVC